MWQPPRLSTKRFERPKRDRVLRTFNTARRATHGDALDRCTKKFARTVRAHRELILNYFRARKQFSSGIVEGLNNK
ncbi:transposase [Paraburkholderia sp. SIMBA_049]